MPSNTQSSDRSTGYNSPIVHTSVALSQVKFVTSVVTDKAYLRFCLSSLKPGLRGFVILDAFSIRESVLCHTHIWTLLYSFNAHVSRFLDSL